MTDPGKSNEELQYSKQKQPAWTDVRKRQILDNSIGHKYGITIKAYKRLS